VMQKGRYREVPALLACPARACSGGTPQTYRRSLTRPGSAQPGSAWPGPRT